MFPLMIHWSLTNSNTFIGRSQKNTKEKPSKCNAYRLYIMHNQYKILSQVSSLTRIQDIKFTLIAHVGSVQTSCLAILSEIRWLFRGSTTSCKCQQIHAYVH